MTPKDKADARRFLARLVLRIAAEQRVANAPGIPRDARIAAAERAVAFASDLSYLRSCYALGLRA